MARGLSERIFRFLWLRYVEGLDEQAAGEAAGIAPEQFREHRMRRTDAYQAAERLLEERIPPEALARYARALHMRLLLHSSDSTAARVAERILQETAHESMAVTFIIQEAEAAEAVRQAVQAAGSRQEPSQVPIAPAPQPACGPLLAAGATPSHLKSRPHPTSTDKAD